jgi:hypothetical protein
LQMDFLLHYITEQRRGRSHTEVLAYRQLDQVIDCHLIGSVFEQFCFMIFFL